MTTVTEHPESGVIATPTTMPIRDITVHPQYRRQDLGKLRDLQQSIRKDGLTRPVPVTADGMLIAGERRLRACQNLGWDRMPVVLACDDAHAVELLAGEQADTGPHCKGRSATELVLVGLLVEQFEQQRAQARRRDGGLNKMPTGQKRQSRTTAAAIVGMAPTHYAQTRRILVTSLGYEPTPGGYSRVPIDPEWAAYSKQTLDLIDPVFAGERIEQVGHSGRHRALSINAIYETWNAEHDRRYPPKPQTDTFYGLPAAGTATGSQRATRDHLTKGLGNLIGLCHGLASITDIDPAITREEAAAFERDLSNASRVLRSLQQKIKEYANGID